MTTGIKYWAPQAGTKGKFPKKFLCLVNLPFPPNGALPPTLSVSPALFAMAAMETGYGKATDWRDFIHFSPSHQAALGTFLSRRLDWILSSTQLSGNQIIPPLFARLIEVSEWGSLSYYLGQIGARLGAEAWLGGQVKRALHYGIYTSDAYIKAGAKVHAVLKVGAQKTPDLLIEDTAGHWHIFEAKGGGPKYRNTAVNKALEQLDAVMAVGPSGFCTTPKSSVCAFTTVNRPDVVSTHPLQIDLVDPPGDGNGIELHITPDVSHLRAIVLDRLVLKRLPRSRAVKLIDQPKFDVRSIGAGRVYALLPKGSKWNTKALQTLNTFQRIMEIFQDYLDSPPTSTGDVPLRIGFIARTLKDRAYELGQRSEDVINTLQSMVSNDELLHDLSGFGLVVSHIVKIDSLVLDAEREREEMRALVRTTLDESRWAMVDSRCGCVFISAKVRQHEDAL